MPIIDQQHQSTILHQSESGIRSKKAFESPESATSTFSITDEDSSSSYREVPSSSRTQTSQILLAEKRMNLHDEGEPTTSTKTVETIQQQHYYANAISSTDTHINNQQHDEITSKSTTEINDNSHNHQSYPLTPQNQRESTSFLSVGTMSKVDEPFQFDLDSNSFSHHHHHHENEPIHELLGSNQETKSERRPISSPNDDIDDLPCIPIFTSPITPTKVRKSNTTTVPHITEINHQHPNKQQPPFTAKSISRSRKVQPVVYSAIGSLEKVNHDALGSFNAKVYRASQQSSIKTRHRGKQNNLSKEVIDIIASSASSTVSANVADDSKIDVKTSADENDHKGDANNNAQMNMKSSSMKVGKKKKDKKKKVTIDSKKEIRHIELFRPSCDAYTPRMERKQIKYKPAEERASMDSMSTTMGTIQRPNFRDALRRVAMIIQQHIVKIEQRFESGVPNNLNLFTRAMRDEFAEENFATPRYKYSMVNMPMGRAGVVYGMRKIRQEYKIPSADDIYEFGHQLFNQVQLSSECSIICLIYVERLMEVAKVPVMAKTWRPILMCGLLLASKVWQDWASWNIEFASVYPQFSLDAINKLEVKFCKMVKWDLYISSSLYAKYYFALRSLLEKQDFRRRYVQMISGADNIAASDAIKISKRSEMVKEKALSHLSMSM